MQVNVDSSSWTNSRGEKLFLRKHTVENPKGVLLFLHGMHSHSGEGPQIKLINGVAAQGFNVLAYDQHAHGRSATTEERGHMIDWNYLVDDAVEFMVDYVSGKKEDYKHELPFFIGGASMGGCVTMLTSYKLQKMAEKEELSKDFITRWRGSLLLCPALYNSIEPPWIVKQMLMTIANLGGGGLRLGPVPNPDNFETPAAYQSIIDDEYCYTGNMFLSLGKNMLAMTAYAQTILGDLNFPFVICHAKGDPVVPCWGSEKLVKDAKSSVKDSKFYDDLPTHCIQEKPKVIKDCWEWINSRLV